jgi:hypothetical protein
MIGTSAGKLVLEKHRTSSSGPGRTVSSVIAAYYIGYGVVPLTGIA